MFFKFLKTFSRMECFIIKGNLEYSVKTINKVKYTFALVRNCNAVHPFGDETDDH